jgi:hypothetical protein
MQLSSWNYSSSPGGTTASVLADLAAGKPVFGKDSQEGDSLEEANWWSGWHIEPLSVITGILNNWMLESRSSASLDAFRAEVAYAEQLFRAMMIAIDYAMDVRRGHKRESTAEPMVMRAVGYTASALEWIAENDPDALLNAVRDLSLVDLSASMQSLMATGAVALGPLGLTIAAYQLMDAFVQLVHRVFEAVGAAAGGYTSGSVLRFPLADTTYFTLVQADAYLAALYNARALARSRL